MPKYVKATAMAVIAHGEYDSGPEPGTHTEIVDGMGVQVHDGFHLEHDDQGHLVEVPDHHRGEVEVELAARHSPNPETVAHPRRNEDERSSWAPDLTVA